MRDSDPRRWWMLAVLGLAELLTMSLWFTASAVAPELRRLWELDAAQAGWLTTAVQVGFVAGTIDLLYRDPAKGALAIADYKNDRVEGDREHRERARSYANQGAEYRRAVGEALQLQALPRFELWFLRTGRVEVVETSPLPPS